MSRYDEVMVLSRSSALDIAQHSVSVATVAREYDACVLTIVLILLITPKRRKHQPRR